MTSKLVGDESLEVEDLGLSSEDSDGFVVDDLGHLLDLVAMEELCGRYCSGGFRVGS